MGLISGFSSVQVGFSCAVIPFEGTKGMSERDKKIDECADLVTVRALGGDGDDLETTSDEGEWGVSSSICPIPPSAARPVFGRTTLRVEALFNPLPLFVPLLPTLLLFLDLGCRRGRRSGAPFVRRQNRFSGSGGGGGGREWTPLLSSPFFVDDASSLLLGPTRPCFHRQNSFLHHVILLQRSQNSLL